MKSLSLAALGLLWIPAFVMPSKTPDWPAWIAGARLAGDAQRLYSFEESQRITQTFVSYREGVWAFVRPPIYATLLRPLAWMAPQQAYALWQISMIACLGIASWLLWPVYGPLVAVLFPPVWISFQQGQDMPLFLLAVVISARLMKRHPFSAGMVLAFCGLQFHLLFLLPVFLIVRRAWRFTAGIAAGGALLLGSCFALYGFGWPALYLRFIAENQRHLAPSWIPIFHPVWWLVTISAGIAAGIAARFVPEDDATALYLVLACSLFLSPHLYPYALVLALPAMVTGLKWFTRELPQAEPERKVA